MYALLRERFNRNTNLLDYINNEANRSKMVSFANAMIRDFAGSQSGSPKGDDLVHDLYLRFSVTVDYKDGVELGEEYVWKHNIRKWAKRPQYHGNDDCGTGAGTKMKRESFYRKSEDKSDENIERQTVRKNSADNQFAVEDSHDELMDSEYSLAMATQFMNDSLMKEAREVDIVIDWLIRCAKQIKVIEADCKKSSEEKAREVDNIIKAVESHQYPKEVRENEEFREAFRCLYFNTIYEN